MALVDKLDDAIAILEGLKAEAGQTAPATGTDAPAPAEGSAPSVDPEALKVLQAKVDALAKENDTLRQAIQAEIDDEKADTARLEAALAPVAEPAPVPVVSVETVADQAQAEAQVSSPDAAAKTSVVQ